MWKARARALSLLLPSRRENQAVSWGVAVMSDNRTRENQGDAGPETRRRPGKEKQTEIMLASTHRRSNKKIMLHFQLQHAIISAG